MTVELYMRSGARRTIENVASVWIEEGMYCMRQQTDRKRMIRYRLESLTLVEEEETDEDWD